MQYSRPNFRRAAELVVFFFFQVAAHLFVVCNGGSAEWIQAERKMMPPPSCGGAEIPRPGAPPTGLPGPGIRAYPLLTPCPPWHPHLCGLRSAWHRRSATSRTAADAPRARPVRQAVSVAGCQCPDQNSKSDSLDLKVNIFVELQHFC